MREFKAESKRVLDLMVNSIYENREVFLRELVSNASDALDKARMAGAQGEPGVHIAFDREERLLTVSDNGIGMDAAALEECLGTIAHSDTGRLKSGGETGMIGQFGVGFYSAFMVADHVRVVSRALGSNEAFTWESDGDGYTIEPGSREECGTDVILHVRSSTADDNFERYLDQSSLQGLVRRYSNYIRYPITMDLAWEEFDQTSGELLRDESRVTRTVVNAMDPIWLRDEGEVGAEELEGFYRDEFGDPEPPLRTMRARARGAIEYDALLFVPSEAPAELFTKDYRYGLRLYSAGVLIDDACDALLPSHLRFVRGVVDTANLHLNVSRESIQEDARIQIIARQIERSVMDGLRAMVADDRLGYERLFAQYGTGLKFAICSSRGTLTNVLNGLLLYWSAREERLISLQEYLDALEPAKHQEVLYAVGNDIDRLRHSPAVSAMLAHGRDVLLCDHGAQDEFCFMVMGTYKGASFHSVTSANLEGTDGDGPLEKDDAVEKVLAALCEHAPVPLVRVAPCACLEGPGDAAARLATDGIMTISMARYVSSKLERGEAPKPLYVLEVNLGHPLFDLARRAWEGGNGDVLANCATVLAGQAMLAEDVPLPDPGAFNRAVNALIAY